jgi:hypothetical protein
MDEAEQRALRVGNPTIADVLTDFTAIEEEAIRRHVRESIAEIERGEYTEYEGNAGLAKLTAGIKTRGRKLLKEAADR